MDLPVIHPHTAAFGTLKSGRRGQGFRLMEKVGAAIGAVRPEFSHMVAAVGTDGDKRLPAGSGFVGLILRIGNPGARNAQGGPDALAAKGDPGAPGTYGSADSFLSQVDSDTGHDLNTPPKSKSHGISLLVFVLYTYCNTRMRGG